MLIPEGKDNAYEMMMKREGRVNLHQLLSDMSYWPNERERIS